MIHWAWTCNPRPALWEAWIRLFYKFCLNYSSSFRNSAGTQFKNSYYSECVISGIEPMLGADAGNRVIGGKNGRHNLQIPYFGVSKSYLSQDSPWLSSGI